MAALGGVAASPASAPAANASVGANASGGVAAPPTPAPTPMAKAPMPTTTMSVSTMPPTVIPVMRHENKIAHAMQEGKSTQQTIAQGNLSHRIQAMAGALPDGETKTLLQNFRICASCKEFRRLGDAHGGGYVTCMDGEHDGHIVAAYSVGLKNGDRWSHDVYKALRIPVHELDCSAANRPKEPCARCFFQEACLKAPDGEGAVRGKTSWTLREALRHTGMLWTRERSLLMKVDASGAEWPIFAYGNDEDVLKRFDQLILQFHRLSNEAAHSQYNEAMQNLREAGFRVAHVHGNNSENMYVKGAYTIPDVVEVTMLSRGPALSKCLPKQVYSPQNASDNSKIPELPYAKLPQ